MCHGSGERPPTTIQIADPTIEDRLGICPLCLGSKKWPPPGDVDDTPEVEVTESILHPVPTDIPTPVRRSGARNVSDARLQSAFIDEARSAMGQPSPVYCEDFIGQQVMLIFNVDRAPVKGELTQVLNHSNGVTYLVLDDNQDVLWPLNSVQEIRPLG